MCLNREARKLPNLFPHFSAIARRQIYYNSLHKILCAMKIFLVCLLFGKSSRFSSLYKLKAEKIYVVFDSPKWKIFSFVDKVKLLSLGGADQVPTRTRLIIFEAFHRYLSAVPTDLAAHITHLVQVYSYPKQ